MHFKQLKINGAFGISGETKTDIRGSLIRTWDVNSQLSDFKINQSSFAHNPLKGTLRGLHFQVEPFSERKIVLCVSGRVFDVILDLRPESDMFGMHLGFEIGQNCEYFGIIVPAGCAHGYLTMEANSNLLYFMDTEFSENHSRGVHWNDSKFAVKWPYPPEIISEHDSNWPMRKA
jgi:dTDP-4-dehydrorhamnose 3,5-epimerase